MSESSSSRATSCRDALEFLVHAAEDFVSSDPDMPSHMESERVYELAVEKARKVLASPSETEALAEAKEYGRLNAERAATLQTINGERNATIDGLRRDLRTCEDKLQHAFAQSAIGTLSLGGCAPTLYGSGGTTGNLGPFGLLVHADPKMPDDTMEFRDRVTGRLLGKIINVGKA